MAKSSNQKGKILYLEHYLHGTGENHVVTMQDILTYLAERGIRAERKSIYDDLEVLREFGMDIRYRRGKPGGYYVAEHSGTVSEELPYASQPESPASAELSQPESSALAELSQPESPASAELSQPESPASADHVQQEPLSHILFGTDEEYRQIRLQCPEEFVEQIRRVFGEDMEIRQRMGDDVLISVNAPDTPAFYGWLTAMGTEVHLIKPRKMIQSFREYLKTLAREYKFS